MKHLYLLFFLLLSTIVKGQTIINSPSINKYANVVVINYCENTIEIPAGLGSQFVVGEKLMLIQMKGASLLEGNDANTGKIDRYNYAGNYEINEIKTISSEANDIIHFKYKINRGYKISGAVQIVNIPEYTDVVFQNTLTCQAWNGSFGGILTFKATGTATLNADIGVSEKGFRGGASEDDPGCFGAIGYTGYNCDNTTKCGAQKGEGIGGKHSLQELARAPNGNGGGGGNDHNAGGAGGGAFGFGGVGGDISNTFCGGSGGFGGEKLDYNGTLNKLFFAGAGGAGDANNISTTASLGISGGNAGALVFIQAENLQANGNKIISNGESKINDADSDGGGGGGAGGIIVLDITNYNDALSIEALGGKGADVVDGIRCPGPGGGGSGGAVWVSQSSTVANISLLANGGSSGVISLAPCAGATNGAQNGENGGFYFNFEAFESEGDFEKLHLIAGTDTTLCGSEPIPLWADASASEPIEFMWTWSSGSNPNYNFDFMPDFPGLYSVLASAEYTVHDQTCQELYYVNVDIRNPKIEIIASSFFGDTIKIGDPVFVNAIVSPLNPNYTYEWTPKDQVDPSNERNAIASPFETQEVCLTVTDEIGCSNTACTTIYVSEAFIKTPNAFSPNGDELNDSFIPILSEDLEVVLFEVYNRWGDLVYSTKENIAWDGKKQGQEQPLDTYLWHIKTKQIISNKIYELQGSVAIVR